MVGEMATHLDLDLQGSPRRDQVWENFPEIFFEGAVGGTSLGRLLIVAPAGHSKPAQGSALGKNEKTVGPPFRALVFASFTQCVALGWLGAHLQRFDPKTGVSRPLRKRGSLGRSAGSGQGPLRPPFKP